jgi:hypothetical protein
MPKYRMNLWQKKFTEGKINRINILSDDNR